MAGDWIKMRCELGHDPDVIQIASIVGLDEFAVVGRLHAVWSWLDQHSETGTNVRIVSAYLDRLTACPGFADAMRTVGWLDGRDGDLSFPGYEAHNGDTAKRRAVETKRKRKQRDKRPVRDGTNVPPRAGPEKRREDSTHSHSQGPAAAESGKPSAPGAASRLDSLDAAVAYAAAQWPQLDPDTVREWWAVRERDGWRKSTGAAIDPRQRGNDLTAWVLSQAKRTPTPTHNHGRKSAARRNDTLNQPGRYG